MMTETPHTPRRFKAPEQGASHSSGAVGMHPVAQRSRVSRSKRPQNRMSGKMIALIAVLIVALAGGAFLSVRFMFGTNNQNSKLIAAGTEVHLTVSNGMGGSQIAQALVDLGLFSDTKEVLAELSSQDVGNKLKTGNYVFYGGVSAADVVKQLVKGPNDTSAQLQIPEGYTLKKIAATVEQTFGIGAQEFLNQAKASNYVADFSFLSEAQNDSLEGFLYPKTYNFAGQQVTADLIIRTMLKQYQTELQQLDMDKARAAIQVSYGVTMSNYDFLTLASIVEKEADMVEDRAVVADVFYKRLGKNMNLQSDATKAYELGRQATSQDLKVDSPWNTYTRKGLPLTPISVPSEESLLAVLKPATTNYWYFYIDGSYRVFSETFEQHKAAIAQAPEH